MKTIFSVVATVAFLATPVQSFAQHENIRYRSIALEACNVEDFGGYPDYQTCTEETYQYMVYYGAYPVFYTPGYNGEVRILSPLGCFYKPGKEWCRVD